MVVCAVRKLPQPSPRTKSRKQKLSPDGRSFYPVAVICCRLGSRRQPTCGPKPLELEISEFRRFGHLIRSSIIRRSRNPFPGWKVPAMTGSVLWEWQLKRSSGRSHSAFFATSLRGISRDWSSEAEFRCGLGCRRVVGVTSIRAMLSV